MTTMAETRPSAVASWERHTPLAGVLAVACWVIGLGIMGDISGKDTGDELLAYYRAHDGKIIAGTVIFLIGVGLFLWFLGTLRSRLLAAEGGDGRLTALAYGAGVATSVCLALQPGPDISAVLAKDDLVPSAAKAVHTVGDAFFLGAEYLLPVMLVAFAMIAMRTGTFPKWLAWVSLLVALVLLIAPIGWAALVFAFPIWVLIVAGLLWKPMGSMTRTAGP
jgi:hypothetical protein